MRSKTIAVILIILAAFAALITFARNGRVFNIIPLRKDEAVNVSSDASADVDDGSVIVQYSDEGDLSAEKADEERPAAEESHAGDTDNKAADTDAEDSSSGDPYSEDFAFPDYTGEPYIILNDNIPRLRKKRKKHSQEKYIRISMNWVDAALRRPCW